MSGLVDGVNDYLQDETNDDELEDYKEECDSESDAGIYIIISVTITHNNRSIASIIKV